MQNVQSVVELLGGTKVVGELPRNDRDFVRLVRRGLPYRAVTSTVRALKLSEDETLESLHMSPRTASRRKADNQRLRSSETERLLRLVRAAATAEDVLGDRPRAVRWLRKPNRTLGGEAPIGLMDTDVGFQEVIDALRRIEHGVFS